MQHDLDTAARLVANHIAEHAGVDAGAAYHALRPAITPEMGAAHPSAALAALPALGFGAASAGDPRGFSPATFITYVNMFLPFFVALYEQYTGKPLPPIPPIPVPVGPPPSGA